MSSHSLLNVIRLSVSYLSQDDILRMVKGDLSVHNMEILKELAKVLGVKGGIKKADLVIEIRMRLQELEATPLTHSALILEAQKKNIPLSTFSYRDLRMLLGYDVVKDAGIVYVLQRRTALTTILANTAIGSHQRLSRLQRDAEAMNEWCNLYPSFNGDKDVYNALYSKAVPLTAVLGASSIFYTSYNDDIGHILLTTAPGSLKRQELLKEYDPSLLQEFKNRVCGLGGSDTSPDPDLLTQLFVDTPSESFIPTFYYTHDEDTVLTTLANSAPNTLKRYVLLAAVESYNGDHHEENLYSAPQLQDYRPHKLPNFTVQELPSLPLPILQSLAVREGISNSVFAFVPDLLEQLYISYCSPTFIQTSVIERTAQQTTTLLNALHEVGENQLYAYGLRDGTGLYHYFERDELLLHFRSTSAFTNPYTNECFSSATMARLALLSLNDEEGGEELRTCISTLTSSTGIEERRVIASLRERKEEVGECLVTMFEAGMYMRRWNGDDSRYPLAAIDTRPTEESMEEEGALEERVNAALAKMKGEWDAMGEVVWGLALRNYIRSGYIISSDVDDGKTVRERFDIVLQGNRPEAPMASCMRLSSGWFIFTALYYHRLLFNTDLKGVLPHQVEFIH